MSELNFIKNWDVIDFIELCDEIADGNNKHPVMKEKQYQIINKSKGNNKAVLEWIGDDENMPIVNDYLLNCGFNREDKVLFWISW